MKYSRVSRTFFGVPLLLEKNRADLIGHYLAGRMGGEYPNMREEFDEINMVGEQIVDVDQRFAVIPVIGELVHRASDMDAMSGMVSYGSLRASFNAAMEDDSIEGIAFDMGTPGGEVAGVFALAEDIYNARGTKPIVAFANEQMSSAGYLIGSAADKIVVPSTGYVGSIGVVTAHMDVSQALEAEGVVMTYIYAGEHKVDGNPYEPLSDASKSRIQSDIDDLYGMFTQTVARNRDMTVQQVIDTKAEQFMGEKSIEMGLADEVGNMEEVLSLLIEGASSLSTKGGLTMSESTEVSNEAQELEASADVEQIEVDALAEEVAHDAAAAERGRIKAIMSLEAADANPGLANHLAYETEMSVEEAEKILAASAPVKVEEKEVKKPKSLAEKMENEDTPNVGVDIPAAENNRVAASVQRQKKMSRTNLSVVNTGGTA